MCDDGNCAIEQMSEENAKFWDDLEADKKQREIDGAIWYKGLGIDEKEYVDTKEDWARLRTKWAQDKIEAWFGKEFYWLFFAPMLTPIELLELDNKNPLVDGVRDHRLDLYLDVSTKKRLDFYVMRVNIGLSMSDTKEEFKEGYSRQFDLNYAIKGRREYMDD